MMGQSMRQAARFAVMVIGGSAGSLEPLALILRQLPAGFGAALVVVIHSPQDQPSALPFALARHCRLGVHEAEDKEALAPGTVLVAPPGYHLLIEAVASVALSLAPPERFSRPSIDVAFSSAAHALGPRVIAVLLSGANDDGAQGLAEVQRAGGLALVQSPDEAASPTMPAAGLLACPQAEAWPALALGERLRCLGSTTTRGEPP